MGAELSRETVKEMLARGELPTINQVAASVELTTRHVDDIEPKVKIIDKIEYIPQSAKLSDIVKHYRKRYEFLKHLLLNHPNTSDAISIGKLSYSGASKATIIGMISEVEIRLNNSTNSKGLY